MRHFTGSDGPFSIAITSPLALEVLGNGCWGYDIIDSIAARPEAAIVTNRRGPQIDIPSRNEDRSVNPGRASRESTPFRALSFYTNGSSLARMVGRYSATVG
jgi:hypothetical protein